MRDRLRTLYELRFVIHMKKCVLFCSTPDHLLLDRSPNIGPLISRWELDKFKNCWNKSFRTSKILTLLYQQFPNLVISQRDLSGPRLGALPNNRWSGGITWGHVDPLDIVYKRIKYSGLSTRTICRKHRTLQGLMMMMMTHITHGKVVLHIALSWKWKLSQHIIPLSLIFLTLTQIAREMNRDERGRTTQRDAIGAVNHGFKTPSHACTDNSPRWGLFSY